MLNKELIVYSYISHSVTALRESTQLRGAAAEGGRRHPAGRRGVRPTPAPWAAASSSPSNRALFSSSSAHFHLMAHNSASVAFCLCLCCCSCHWRRIFAVHVSICGHCTYVLLPCFFPINEDWVECTPSGLNISKSHSPALEVNSCHTNILVFSGCSACTLLRSLVSLLHISCITWGLGSSS